MRTCSGRTSSSSAAICVSAVRMPWPISTLPVPTRTRPGSSNAIHCDRIGLSIRLCGSVLEIMRALPAIGAGRALHRADDAVVDAAAAEMRIERGDDVGAARLRIASQQRRRRDQDAGEAIAALAGLLVEERLLQRMQRAVARQPFDGGDGFAGDASRPRACRNRPARRRSAPCRRRTARCRSRTRVPRRPSSSRSTDSSGAPPSASTRTGGR